MAGEVNILGGTVIKFADGAFWDFMGTLNTWAGDYYPSGLPATLTSKDDNTVGEMISGSTGNPTGAGGILMQGSCNENSLHGLNFDHGVYIWFHCPGQFDLWNCNFLHGSGFATSGDGWDQNTQTHTAAQTILHNVTYGSGSIRAQDIYGCGMSVVDASVPVSAAAGGWLSLDVTGSATDLQLQWQEQQLDPDGNPYSNPVTFDTSLNGSGRVATPLSPAVGDGLTVTVLMGRPLGMPPNLMAWTPMGCLTRGK